MFIFWDFGPRIWCKQVKKKVLKLIRTFISFIQYACIIEGLWSVNQSIFIFSSALVTYSKWNNCKTIGSDVAGIKTHRNTGSRRIGAQAQRTTASWKFRQLRTNLTCFGNKDIRVIAHYPLWNFNDDNYLKITTIITISTTWLVLNKHSLVW